MLKFPREINGKSVFADLSGHTLDDVDEEVLRARTKFPGSRFLYTALCEEVGELAKAILQKEGRDRVRREALQVACVALRIYEEGDPAYDDLTDGEALP